MNNAVDFKEMTVTDVVAVPQIRSRYTFAPRMQDSWSEDYQVNAVLSHSRSCPPTLLSWEMQVGCSDASPGQLSPSICIVLLIPTFACSLHNYLHALTRRRLSKHARWWKRQGRLSERSGTQYIQCLSRRCSRVCCVQWGNLLRLLECRSIPATKFCAKRLRCLGGVRQSGFSSASRCREI